jgi:lysophospholipase L1-like esterase/dienelactone hydrolase
MEGLKDFHEAAWVFKRNRIYCLSICLTVLMFTRLSAKAQNIKVVCIGASITYGARIENRDKNSYPAQLQAMLGMSYTVYNYGVSGCTLLKKGDRPYWATKQYQEALAMNPDVVVIDLGGNDSKLINRIYIDDFEQDYRDFIRSFSQLPSQPRIILLSAMPSFVRDTTGIWDQAITKKINPRIQNVAFSEKKELIDMHSPFVNKESIMPDKIHPDKEGATIMAKTIYTNLVKKRDKAYDITSAFEFPIKKSSFYGYECIDFSFKGRSCKIVKPKLTAKGHPWVWRARFWGHEPQTDIALLQNGFHIVYCDVAELLGNPEAIAAWDNYYSLLRKAGLGKKAVMEGMSRGGIYVFNWAAANPDKVAGVYVDNPLLNISAWASAMFKASNEKNPMLKAFVADYGLKDEEDIRAFKKNPVDQVKQIAKGRYPILIVCADADEDVSPRENTLLFEQRIKGAKGNITVIHKPGFKHHPHSLPNPEPIVEFILKTTNQ